MGKNCSYHHSEAEMLKIWINEAPNTVIAREKKPIKPITANSRYEGGKDRPSSSK
jgi:hypothetical protein